MQTKRPAHQQNWETRRQATLSKKPQHGKTPFGTSIIKKKKLHRGSCPSLEMYLEGRDGVPICMVPCNLVVFYRNVEEMKCISIVAVTCVWLMWARSECMCMVPEQLTQIETLTLFRGICIFPEGSSSSQKQDSEFVVQA